MERGILFKPDMVKAILDGRKTQTRRIVKPQPPNIVGLRYEQGPYPQDFHPRFTAMAEPANAPWLTCPYGQPGDRLYVKEAWAKSIISGDFIYKTNLNPLEDQVHSFNGVKWNSPMMMPKRAARLWLEITGVRVERLQDISEEDAIAEGSFLNKCACFPPPKTPIESLFQLKWCHQHGQEIKALWKSIYGPGSWELTPWVWIIEFQVVL